MWIWVAIISVFAIAMANACWLNKMTRLLHDLSKETTDWMEIQENINVEVTEFIRKVETP